MDSLSNPMQLNLTACHLGHSWAAPTEQWWFRCLPRREREREREGTGEERKGLLAKSETLCQKRWEKLRENVKTKWLVLSKSVHVHANTRYDAMREVLLGKIGEWWLNTTSSRGCDWLTKKPFISFIQSSGFGFWLGLFGFFGLFGLFGLFGFFQKFPVISVEPQKAHRKVHKSEKNMEIGSLRSDSDIPLTLGDSVPPTNDGGWWRLSTSQCVYLQTLTGVLGIVISVVLTVIIFRIDQSGQEQTNAYFAAQAAAQNQSVQLLRIQLALTGAIENLTRNSLETAILSSRLLELIQASNNLTNIQNDISNAILRKTQENSQLLAKLVASSNQIQESSLILQRSSHQIANLTLQLSDSSNVIQAQTLSIATSSNNIHGQSLEIAASSNRIANQTLDISKSSKQIAAQTLDIQTSSNQIAAQTLDIQTSSNQIATQTLNISVSSNKIQAQTLGIQTSSNQIAAQTLGIQTSTLQVQSATQSVAQSSLAIQTSSFNQLTQTDENNQKMIMALRSSLIWHLAGIRDAPSATTFIDTSARYLCTIRFRYYSDRSESSRQLDRLDALIGIHTEQTSLKLYEHQEITSAPCNTGANAPDYFWRWGVSKATGDSNNNPTLTWLVYGFRCNESTGRMEFQAEHSAYPFSNTPGWCGNSADDSAGSLDTKLAMVQSCSSWRSFNVVEDAQSGVASVGYGGGAFVTRCNGYWSVATKKIKIPWT